MSAFQHALSADGLPAFLAPAIAMADASWRPAILAGIRAMHEADPQYFGGLEHDAYLPTQDRLFAAFRQPLDGVRHVLFGEGPYPREESATGVSFMDGAVGALWSIGGLSKPVNRATSLRNFMKMLLVVEGALLPEKTTGDALAPIAAQALQDDGPWIRSLPELQENMLKHGFLLLNASLVFRRSVAPMKDAKAWRPFMESILQALAAHAQQVRREPPKLVLWGKIAGYIESLPISSNFPKVASEHPYNLSFIANPLMQALFGPMRLLHRQD